MCLPTAEPSCYPQCHTPNIMYRRLPSDAVIHRPHEYKRHNVSMICTSETLETVDCQYLMLLFENTLLINSHQANYQHDTRVYSYIIIIIIAYLYSANFICVSRHNAQKRFIVFIMDWSRNYTYKLSKCFIEQVSFKSGLQRVNRWSLLYAEG